MRSGFPNDVNNGISIGDVYNFDDFPVDIGVPDSGLSDTAPTMDVVPGVQASNNTLSASVTTPLGMTAYWWLTLFAMFAGFVWLARRYGGGDKYSNIRASVYNLFFLTVFIVLMLNFLKVVARHWNIPGFSPLVLAA